MYAAKDMHGIRNKEKAVMVEIFWPEFIWRLYTDARVVRNLILACILNIVFPCSEAYYYIASTCTNTPHVTQPNIPTTPRIHFDLSVIDDAKSTTFMGGIQAYMCMCVCVCVCVCVCKCTWVYVFVCVSLSLSHTLTLALSFSRSLALSLSCSLALSLPRSLALTPSRSRSSCQRLENTF